MNDKLLQHLEEIRRQNKAGLELRKLDDEDPERGSIVQQVRAIERALWKYSGNENSIPYSEFEAFKRSFLEHFGKTEARRYRLFHVILGSTPPGNADLFDAEGEWSIAEAMQNLTEKYHIDHIDTKAA